MNKLKYIFILFILLMTAYSCKIGAKFHKPELHLPEAFENSAELEQDVAADMGWGTLYTDTVLQNLIDSALTNNKDMLIAASRIREMMYSKRITKADLFPGVGMEAYAQKEQLDYSTTSGITSSPEIRTVFTFAWEIDIWGNLRWQNDVAIAAYMQTVEAQRALHLSLVAQVAQTYFELKALNRELTIVQQTVHSRSEETNFAKIRYEGGLTSEIPYRQSLVELARTETMVPNLEYRIKAKENDLWILLGKYPMGSIPQGENIENLLVTKELPVDIPSSILKRRPDVLMAEQKLVQANAQVGVAFTDMFPTIRLTGRYGLENTELTDFLKSPAWFAMGSLTGPIFQMGKNKARHKAAKEAYQQEIYNYQKTILNVFREVNDAIMAFNKMREVRQSQESLYQSAKTYHNLAQLQYINGVISYMDVLDAQRQLFSAETALNTSILNEMLSVVDLYRALGGGLVK